MASDSSKKKARLSPTLYEAFDFAVVRAPLLPMETYVNLGAWAPTPEGAATLAPTDPEIRRALAISSFLRSSTLLDRTTRAATRHRASLENEAAPVRRSESPAAPYASTRSVLLEYRHLSRRTGRGGKPERLNSKKAPCTRTRVDMDWLVRYVLSLDKQPAIRTQLQWVANSSFWFPPRSRAEGRRRRRLDRRHVGRTKGARPHAYSHPLRRLAPAARRELARGDASQGRAPAHAALGAGIQYFTLSPHASGHHRRPDSVGADDQAPLMGGKSLCVQLDALLATIDACDSVSVEEVPRALKKATSHVELLGSSDTKMPLQVDMALGLDGGHLSSAIAEEAARTADLLFSTRAARRPANAVVGPGRVSAVVRGENTAPVPRGSAPRGAPAGVGARLPRPAPQVSSARARRDRWIAAPRRFNTWHCGPGAKGNWCSISTSPCSSTNQRPRASDLPASIDLDASSSPPSRAALDSSAFQLLLRPQRRLPWTPAAA